MRCAICEMGNRHCDKSLSQEINFFEHSHLVHINLFRSFVRSFVSPKNNNNNNSVAATGLSTRFEITIAIAAVAALVAEPNEKANNWLKQISLILLWLFLAQTL